MPLRLYDTYSKKEKEFIPRKKGEVTMYTCGPTVYGRPHIGNYSSFLMADLLRRWLEVSGYTVKHVKNITDVGHLVADRDGGEDKIEKQARHVARERRGGGGDLTKEEVMSIAREYEAQYLEDEKALNMKEPFARPRATETIPEMIAIIEVLLKEGHAYETEDGVYFSVESFPAYGKLSGNTIENVASGSRIEVDEKKKHPADFALWKKTVGSNADHILRWTSPWGEGFPGWHIECSAMSRKFLGEQIDLHTGGEDNIFPHHECEIAQSECSGKKPFVRLWLHKRRIDLGSEKMSKSLGNVLTIPDILAMGFSPLDLRYYLLSVHYRTQLKFTKKGLEDAHKARRRVMEWMEEVGGEDREEKKRRPAFAPGSQELRTGRGGDEWQQKFAYAMYSDLNTPGALGVVFEAMAASRKGKELGSYRAFLSLVRETFGCFEPESAGSIPGTVMELLEQRKAARAKKDFAASDRLRDEIRTLGYEVRDEGKEQTVKKL
ncbi:cysteine--tRNA ligase [Candidatus Peregrinibacteria bacterium]|nr:cysteine--tRNA ligase [Candidatus Peregrinibacteria bacterium]